MSERVERAVEALRKPDHSLARVVNTVRQSLAEVIEDQQKRIEALEAALWEIDKHLADFGYGETMKARKMIAAALSL